MREGFLKEVISSSGPGGEEKDLGGLAVRRDSGLSRRMDWMTCCFRI